MATATAWSVSPAAGARPRQARLHRRARPEPGADRTATARRCGAIIPTASCVVIVRTSVAWTATTTARPANGRRRSFGPPQRGRRPLLGRRRFQRRRRRRSHRPPLEVRPDRGACGCATSGRQLRGRSPQPARRALRNRGIRSSVSASTRSTAGSPPPAQRPASRGRRTSHGGRVGLAVEPPRAGLPRMPSSSPAGGRTPPWWSATPRASALAREPSASTCADRTRARMRCGQAGQRLVQSLPDGRCSAGLVDARTAEPAARVRCRPPLVTHAASSSRTSSRCDHGTARTSYRRIASTTISATTLSASFRIA